MEPETSNAPIIFVVDSIIKVYWLIVASLIRSKIFVILFDFNDDSYFECTIINSFFFTRSMSITNGKAIFNGKTIFKEKQYFINNELESHFLLKYRRNRHYIMCFVSNSIKRTSFFLFLEQGYDISKVFKKNLTYFSL